MTILAIANNKVMTSNGNLYSKLWLINVAAGLALLTYFYAAIYLLAGKLKYDKASSSSAFFQLHFYYFYSIMIAQMCFISSLKCYCRKIGKLENGLEGIL